MEHSPLFGGHAEQPVISASEGRKLASLSETVARWAVYLSVLLVPILYIPGTIEMLEAPKHFALVALTVVATLAWLGKMLVERRVVVRRSVTHLLVLVFLALYGASAWLSTSRYASIVGDFGQQKAGFLTVLCFVLLYLVAVNVLKDGKQLRNAVHFLLIGGLATLVHSYLRAFGVQLLPGTPAPGTAFNLIGTANAQGVLAAVLLSLTMGLMLAEDRDRFAVARKALLGVTGALSLIYIGSLSFWGLWVMVIVAALVLVIYGMVKTEKVARVTMLAVPMAAIVIGGLFSFVRFPNLLHLPAEVMPSWKASWSISKEALARAPLFGSGPGTFLYNYAKYRAADLNNTNFWSVQFDRSSSRALTQLATTGILGFAAFAVLVLFLTVRTAITLARGQDDWLLTLSVFAGWCALLTGRLFYSSNLTLELLFWSFTAWLVALEWKQWGEARFERSPRAALLLSFSFIVAVILSVAGLYLEGQRYVADRHYAKGVTHPLNVEADVQAAIESIGRATQLNPRNDLYFRTLSQSLAIKANLEIQKAGGRPNEEQARLITLLARDAVNAGKHAVDMNGADVRNWTSLASLYRDLGPSVVGALDAAEQAYKTTIELEPSNPIAYTELGKIYLTMADQALTQEDKEAGKKASTEKLKMAREQFDKAVSLKQDYAPAHYWIALLLEREGKNDEAIGKLESVRNYNPSDLGVGFQLAILYYQNDHRDKAITELERIIRMSSDYANARWYLAAMYEEAGRVDDAIAQIEEVLRLNPGNADIQKRLEGLRSKKAGGSGNEEGLPEPVNPPTDETTP